MVRKNSSLEAKKRRRQPLRTEFVCDGMPPEEMARVVHRMELYDGLPEPGRELVRDYGLALGQHAARQFYGRWDEARAFAEAQRQANERERLRTLRLNLRRNIT